MLKKASLFAGEGWLSLSSFYTYACPDHAKRYLNIESGAIPGS